MTTANIIRDVLKYAAKTNFEHGGVSSAIMNVLDYATDAELIRFSEMISNVLDAEIQQPPMDSAELARANID